MPSIWYDGQLVDMVVIVNPSGEVPVTSGENSNPRQDGILYDTVYVMNPSG